MSSFIDQFRDIFRKWLGISLGDTDRKLMADSERAAELLDERAAAYLGKVYSDAAAKFERRMAEQRKQFDEAEPLTFDGVFEEIPAPPAGLAAPAKQEPEAPASATPPEAAAPEPPAPEQEAAPVQNEQRATPKAEKKPASVKKTAKASASAVPTEPPAPEQAAPSPKMDDAALAAAILKQSERREAGKRK
jgi:hypothetical protein